MRQVNSTEIQQPIQTSPYQVPGSSVAQGVWQWTEQHPHGTYILSLRQKDEWIYRAPVLVSGEKQGRGTEVDTRRGCEGRARRPAWPDWASAGMHGKETRSEKHREPRPGRAPTVEGLLIWLWGRRKVLEGSGQIQSDLIFKRNVNGEQTDNYRWTTWLK